MGPIVYTERHLIGLGLGPCLNDNQVVGDYYSVIESPAVDFANGQFQ